MKKNIGSLLAACKEAGLEEISENPWNMLIFRQEDSCES